MIHKTEWYAIASILAGIFGLYLLMSTAMAAPVSEHNEQHAAEMAAQNALFDAGCTRTNIKRTARWAVHSETGSQTYVVTGNGLTVECVKWESSTAPIWKISWTAPTTRADGSPLRPDEIAGYRVTVNGNEIEPLVSAVEIVTDLVSLGDTVGLQTVDNSNPPLVSAAKELVLE